MMTTGKTKTFGLIANPVEHTMSPFIHKMFYDKGKIDAVYVPFQVEKNRLEEGIKGIRSLGIAGANISVPHKIEALTYIDEIDFFANMIGAVNTICIEKDKIVGYNTDWIGLAMAFKYENLSLLHRDIVIIGAGGAARAAAFMSAKLGARLITIINRTKAKADDILQSIQKNYEEVMKYQHKTIDTFVAWQEKLNIDMSKRDEKQEENHSPIKLKSYDMASLKEHYTQLPNKSIVIQTTPIGMYPEIEYTPIQEVEFFRKVDFIMEIIYNPRETKFLQIGKKQGIAYANGLPMLFFQAAKSFEIWTGITFEEDDYSNMLKVLTSHVYAE